MSSRFVRKTRDETIRYSRPSKDTFRNKEGNVVYAPVDGMRYDYDAWGHFLGIKFGDGDSAIIPNAVATSWKGTQNGTMVVLAQAETGVVFFRCGTLELKGIQGHKLYIVDTSSHNLADSIELFPNKNTEQGEKSHVLLVKYYDELVTFDGDEKQNMDEWNTFMNEDWR